MSFIFVAAVSFIGGIVTTNSQLVATGINQILGNQELNLSSVQQTYQKLIANYDGDIDQTKLIEGANRGLVDALGDQYTVYMNKAESTEFDNSLTGNIGGGIGVELGIRSNLPTVIRLLKDNPAEKAGLAVNDIVIKVNDEATEGKDLSEITSKIRGEAGTSIKITVVRDGAERDFSITRETVNNPSAYGSVTNDVGVMTVTRFDNETGRQVRSLAQEFKDQGVKGVVLDLRGNGGGYLTAAQSVAGVWLDNQLVVTEKRGKEVVDELSSTGRPILNGVPTVVLVNQSSASASEIVAGALKDHKAATLIGETTFGKGSVQQLLDLMDGATLKVTIARWYTPSGLNISEKGITPDQVVERTADDINAGRDGQLDAALGSF
jgi:carboxyl-terminal processing protease